ncbi:hypothetical protein [Clostridium butyricum]|uniref:hypothetical protein n=1 Tax=Clostridium butyricum TaxID=1492 RepID=UPI00325BA4A3
MKKKILGILLGALLLRNITIPTFAYVDNGQLNIYENKLSMIRNEFSYSSGINDATGLNNAEIKARTFLGEINSYIKSNTTDKFQEQCNNVTETMEKYRVYKYNQLKEEEKQAGFGTMYGREYHRINFNNYIDTCDMLIDDLRNYNKSFDWYVTEANEDYEHWRIEDGNWKYYDNNGKMLKNTIIDGRLLGADGSLIM